MTPRVHVGPGELPEVEAAVVAGGCTVERDVLQADAVVWWGKDAAELGDALHDGVRWLQLPDAGIGKWMTAGVLVPGRTVTSARGIYGPQVAEHALALLLACTRRLGPALRTTTWSPGTTRGTTLAGSSVVVVGTGDIGRSLLRLLRPLGCRTTAVSLRGTPVAEADRTLPADRLDEVLPEADVVVLAAPATDRTKGLLDARRLSLLPSTAYVVNVARGDLVVTEDLVAALDAGRLAGAALDVTDPEPLPDGTRSEPRRGSS